MYQVGLVGLLVRDIDETADFYQKVFGFRMVQQKSTNQKGDSRAFLKSSDVVLELTQLKDGTAGHPEDAIDHIAFFVDDLEKEIGRLVGVGVDLESPRVPGHIPVNRILNVRYGRIFYFRGPNHESIGLVELKQDSPFRTRYGRR